jgi:hypothetical protein
MLVDTILGLVITGMLSTLLVVAITRAGAAQRQMDDGAAADRACQRVMDALHKGQPAPATIGEAKVTVRPAAGGGANVPAGHAWREVVVTYRGRTASLVGLVPANGGGQ